METIVRWQQRLQRGVAWIIGLALMALLCVILLQTFTRYVIFYSLPWSEELSRYLFVVMILFGINIGVSRGIMVRIDLIDSFLSGRAKRCMELFREIIALIVASCFLYSTFGIMRIGAFQRSPAMQIRMDFLYGVLCIGFLMTLAAVVLNIIVKIDQLRREGGE